MERLYDLLEFIEGFIVFSDFVVHQGQLLIHLHPFYFIRAHLLVNAVFKLSHFVKCLSLTVLEKFSSFGHLLGKSIIFALDVFDSRFLILNQQKVVVKSFLLHGELVCCDHMLLLSLNNVIVKPFINVIENLVAALIQVKD